MKYRGPIHRTTVSSSSFDNLTIYNLFNLQETRDYNYPEFFYFQIYLCNTTTWNLIGKIVVAVVVVVEVVVVVVVVVVYGLQYSKLEISETFSSFLFRCL
jgi:hypothetical protein